MTDTIELHCGKWRRPRFGSFTLLETKSQQSSASIASCFLNLSFCVRGCITFMNLPTLWKYNTKSLEYSTSTNKTSVIYIEVLGSFSCQVCSLFSYSCRYLAECRWCSVNNRFLVQLQWCFPAKTCPAFKCYTRKQLLSTKCFALVSQI